MLCSLVGSDTLAPAKAAKILGAGVKRFLNTLVILSFIFHSFIAKASRMKAMEDEILERAEQTNTDSLIVMQDGKEILSFYSGRHLEPIEFMSGTKSIVNLAIGLLVDEGAIENIDLPVSTYYPEWNRGLKRNITIRHLLNHTSGIQARSTTEDIYASPNFVQFALEADLSHEPGTHFFYNNKAVNLLAGIVERSSGVRMDRYLRRNLFRSLGIRGSSWSWSFDRSGNPHGMAGLQIKATALAKVGQMILQGGMWKGRRIIDQRWIEQSFEQGQSFETTCGLLWWRRSDANDNRYFYDEELISSYRDASISEEYVSLVESIVGEVFTQPDLRSRLIELFGSVEELQVFLGEVRDSGLKTVNIELGPAKYFSAEGYLGQYLIIIPEKRIVAVRQIHHESANENSQFDDLGQLLLDL